MKLKKNWFRRQLEEIVRLHSSPLSISAGFAAGTLIAVLPTLFIGVLLGVLTVFLFPKLNKFAVFGALALYNPFVLAPLYYLSYLIGGGLLREEVDVGLSFSLLNEAFEFTGIFLVGNAILAVGLALLGFGVVYLISDSAQKRRKLRK